MVEKMEKGKNNAMLQEAREHPNLESALGKFGITLKQVGHGRGGGIRYSTGSKGGREGDYSSLVFFKNPNDTWVVIDNKQRNGKLSYDALGALTELFGMRFADAVQLLSSGGIGFMAQGSASFKETGASEKPLSYLPEKIFRLPEKAPSAKHAAAYLTKARGIRGELVSELMHRGVIYEAIRKSPDGKEMPMVVFPSFDEKRNAVGAECCSAYSSVRFKHIVGGSDPRFGWRFSMGNPPEGAKKLFFCESAIDAMSLFCLTGTPGVYISLAGLKDETMAHMKDFLGGEPVICVDNDAGGEKFRRKHPNCDTLIPQVGKDWNDELKAQHNPPAAQIPFPPAQNPGAVRPTGTKL